MSACVRSPKLGGYRLPNVQRSSDDAQRLTGADVPALTGAELAAELTRLRNAYAAAVSEGCRVTLETCESPYYIPAVLWIAERIRLVQQEIRRRSRAQDGGEHGTFR